MWLFSVQLGLNDPSLCSFPIRIMSGFQLALDYIDAGSEEEIL